MIKRSTGDAYAGRDQPDLGGLLPHCQMGQRRLLHNHPMNGIGYQW